jgi:hypothetical protein
MATALLYYFLLFYYYYYYYYYYESSAIFRITTFDSSTFSLTVRLCVLCTIVHHMSFAALPSSCVRQALDSFEFSSSSSSHETLLFYRSLLSFFGGTCCVGAVE